MPQVHGAVRDALDHLRRVLDIELNSATDNPLVFPGGGVADADTIATGGGRVISGGNFHGEPIALALDFAKLALAELGSISERRTALLVDARLNGGLPPFLAAASGRRLGDDDLPVHGGRPRLGEQGARPSGVGRLDPDIANQEDHVSMGSIAARHARTVLEDVERILAIELRRRGAGARPAARGMAGEATPAGRRRRAPGVAEAHRRDPRAGRAPRPRPRARPGPGRRDGAGPRGRAGRPRRADGRRRRLHGHGAITIVDVTDATTFALVPPCADPGFDHRSCDYWEDADRGSKAARLAWLEPDRPAAGGARAQRPPANPFLADLAAGPDGQPVRAAGAAAARPTRSCADDDDDGRRQPVRAAAAPPRPSVGADAPRKLRLLGRGLGVAGSYAKVLLARRRRRRPTASSGR